jgi:hypothetical protein
LLALRAAFWAFFNAARLLAVNTYFAMIQPLTFCGLSSQAQPSQREPFEPSSNYASALL